MGEFFMHNLVLASVGKYIYHRENKSSSPPLMFFLTTHTEHFNTDTSAHQMCGGFPLLRYTGQFCATPAGVLYFNSILTLFLGDNVRFHRLRSQSHKTELTSDPSVK